MHSFPMKFSIKLLFITFCMAFPVVAQESKEDKPARGRVVHFACTGIPKNLENPVLVRSGKKITKLQISRRMASDAVKIPASGVIEWVIKSDKPDSDPYVPIARAVVPEGISKALVILTPLHKPKGTLIFSAAVQDLASFTGGDYLFINLSPKMVGVKLGKKKLTIKPGKRRVHHVSNLKKSRNTPVSYSFFDPQKKKWKLLSASTIVMRPTRREICIFHWDAKYKRVNYHGITCPVNH